MAMNPQIIKNYAAGDREDMYKLVFRGAKLSYILLLILSLPIAVEAPLVLEIWLKEVPKYTVIFLRLAILTALLNTLSNPLIISTHASGKVRDYQIVVGGISLLTLPIVYVVFKFGAEPYYAMVIAFAVELVCHIARLYMLVRIMDFPMTKFLKSVTIRVYIVTILSIVLPILAYSEINVVVVRFLTVCTLSVLSTLILGYYIGFNKHDREKLLEKAIGIMRKRFKRNNK